MKTFGLSYQQVMNEPEYAFNQNLFFIQEEQKEKERQAKKQRRKAKRK